MNFSFRTLKSASPSMEMMQDNKNGPPMNDGMGKLKGCGRFPTEQIEIGPKQHQHHSPNEVNEKIYGNQH